MKGALIGKGIAASLTPVLHEAAGAALGLTYSYVAMIWPPLLSQIGLWNRP